MHLQPASLAFSDSVTRILHAAAALGVEDQIAEVLLLWFDAEVVMTDAVPLVVEKADEDTEEEEHQGYSQTAETHQVKGVEALL